jgi:hypothetical protein
VERSGDSSECGWSWPPQMSRLIWANEQIVSQESDLSKMKNLLAEVKLELESAKASEVTSNDILSLFQSYREITESELISMKNPFDSTTSELSEATMKLTRVGQAPNAHENVILDLKHSYGPHISAIQGLLFIPVLKR